MLNACCAGVVWKPVVRSARRAERDSVRQVTPDHSLLCRRDSVRGVIPAKRPSCRVVPCRRDAVMRPAARNDGPARRTRRTSRPLRARDHRHVDRFCGRSRPAERQHRWAAGAAWSAIPCWSPESVSDVHARCASLVVLIARCAGVVRWRVVRIARRARRDRVLGVIPPSARYAGVIACRCGAVMPLRHAKLGSQPAQPAVPADRCAREIVRFYHACCGALAAAERQAVGRLGSVVAHPFLITCADLGCTARGADCPLCRRGSIARRADCPLWAA